MRRLWSFVACLALVPLRAQADTINCTGAVCAAHVEASGPIHDVTTSTDSAGLANAILWNVQDNGTDCFGGTCKWFEVKGTTAGRGSINLKFRRGDTATTNGVQSVRILGTNSQNRGVVVSEVLALGTPSGACGTDYEGIAFAPEGSNTAEQFFIDEDCDGLVDVAEYSLSSPVHFRKTGSGSVSGGYADEYGSIAILEATTGDILLNIGVLDGFLTGGTCVEGKKITVVNASTSHKVGVRPAIGHRIFDASGTCTTDADGERLETVQTGATVTLVCSQIDGKEWLVESCRGTWDNAPN